MEKNTPEKKFRSGALSVSIWKNEATTKKGEASSFNTISFERGYKDKDGNWKNTQSLHTTDLPKAAMLMNKAFEYLVLNADEAEA